MNLRSAAAVICLSPVALVFMLAIWSLIDRRKHGDGDGDRS